MTETIDLSTLPVPSEWFTAGQMPTGLNPEGTVLQFEWDHPEYGKQFVSASGMLHLEMIQKWLVRWRLVDKEHRE